MPAILIENKSEHSALLPRRFEQYLLRVFFAPFDQRANTVPLSRNSIGHGIAKPESFDFLNSVLGFMAIDAILYFLSD